jgi:hypothetical protein
VKLSCGRQFYAVPAFIFGAIESLIGGLNHLLGLTIARTRFGYSDADRHRQMIGQAIG